MIKSLMAISKMEGDFMKIEKEISRVEIISTVEELNEALNNGATLIETIKRRDNDIDSFIETVHFVVGY